MYLGSNKLISQQVIPYFTTPYFQTFKKWFKTHNYADMEFMHFYQCTVVFSNYKHSHKCTTRFKCIGIYLDMTASTYGC